MEKPYTLEDRVFAVKKLMKHRGTDFEEFRRYYDRQIVKLTTELDDLKRYIEDLDGAIIEVLTVKSLKEADDITVSFTSYCNFG